MTNADWWARVVQARTAREDPLPKRVCALRKGGREAAIDLRPVPGIGAEIVLTVDGEWRRSRLFRSPEQAGTGRRHRRHRATSRGRDGEDGPGD